MPKKKPPVKSQDSISPAPLRARPPGRKKRKKKLFRGGVTNAPKQITAGRMLDNSPTITKVEPDDNGIIRVTIHEKGFGGTLKSKGLSTVLITRVEEGSLCEQLGLKPGDHLLTIDGSDFEMSRIKLRAFKSARVPF